jgi:RNA polymerase sigma-70 factor (ECF subfamily)
MPPTLPPQDAESDSALVLRVRKGDHAAFAVLVSRHLPAVYTFCVRILNNADEAQDVAQETFLKAWRHLGRFDTKKSFRTWLFAIAKNTATDALRKRRSVSFSALQKTDRDDSFEDTLADTEPLPEELFARASLARDVQQALQQLPPRDRMILSLRYEEELSFEDIADVMEIPANTIRSLHRRALIQLREKLQ